MMEKIKRLTALVITLVLIFSGCSLYTSGGVSGYKNRYKISVFYNPDESSIYGSQKIDYKNIEDADLNEIYFHIYPNAFRSKSTAPVIGGFGDNYPEGFNPGQIDIVGVWINGSPVKWSVEGDAYTLLCIKPAGKIRKNQKVGIKIDYQERLPHARTDFGSYNGIACFENWYPILCVYDAVGWHKESYSKIGEPNFSEVSDYEVEIDLPKDEVVASTGKCIGEKNISSGRKRVTLKADNVRDFAWISSRYFKTVEKKYKGVTIKSFFMNDDREKGVSVLDICCKALDFYNESFGKYPYDVFSVAETSLYGGAMEYPEISSIGQLYYTYKVDDLFESAVVHELAHQWWYVVVGNNEYKEPWLDESMAAYSEYMYFEKYYGKDEMKKRLSQNTGNFKSSAHTGDSMDKFSSIGEYSLVVYIKGAYMLDEFRKKVGDEKFFEIMKKYYSLYKFKNADTNGFLGVVNDVCGDEAVKFIKLRLAGKA